ncbi:Uncharacterised protein [uncultured archaeon]|nr:Uncharacterised protein [uncultured archaeon]
MKSYFFSKRRLDSTESMKETIEVLSDVDIMKQLDEGKKKGTKVRNFEELAKELGI